MTPDWKETTLDGPGTRRWSLDQRQCSELATHRIAWLGLDTVTAPYSRVRLAPSGSFFLACLEGEGRIFLEGRWQGVKPGELCLAPPRVLNAFHALKGHRWTFAWIRYEEPISVQPVVDSRSPLRLSGGAQEIGRVMTGLQKEWEGDRDAALVHHWVSLAHGLSRRAARPARAESRTAPLWERVARALTTEWKLSSLAHEAGVSAEHLRRICRRELGRTPMEHVTYMRIQRAQELLQMTEDKLDAIAPQVGYHTTDVFIRAFVRCVGLTPSQYRERGKTPPQVREQSR
ncbi:MAG TPA: AraC family transcriptional regulator [Opitutaceae bacterium]|nr:AraC family transcriptional regulator [Opitutaceae bacterium]